MLILALLAAAVPPDAALRAEYKAWSQTLVGPEDYPAALRRKGEEGVVTVDIGVAADGRVESCVVTLTSGFPDLDAATCPAVLARVTPAPIARDAAGNPAATLLRLPVRWALED